MIVSAQITYSGLSKQGWEKKKIFHWNPNAIIKRPKLVYGRKGKYSCNLSHEFMIASQTSSYQGHIQFKNSNLFCSFSLEEVDKKEWHLCGNPDEHQRLSMLRTGNKTSNLRRYVLSQWFEACIKVSPSCLIQMPLFPIHPSIHPSIIYTHFFLSRVIRG